VDVAKKGNDPWVIEFEALPLALRPGTQVMSKLLVAVD
jgi:hypothetical protein